MKTPSDLHLPHEDTADFLLLQIEDGTVSMREVGGDWLKDGEREWFISCGEFSEICDNIPETQNRMQTPDVFLVRLMEPDVVIEEAGWDLNYGFDPGGIWLEYRSYRVEEVQNENTI